MGGHWEPTALRQLQRIVEKKMHKCKRGKECRFLAIGTSNFDRSQDGEAQKNYPQNTSQINVISGVEEKKKSIKNEEVMQK